VGDTQQLLGYVVTRQHKEMLAIEEAENLFSVAIHWRPLTVPFGAAGLGVLVDLLQKRRTLLLQFWRNLLCSAEQDCGFCLTAAAHRAVDQAIT
jgi:hypothetical protein